MCASITALEGHVMRGLSCWFKNFIQVTQIQDTVAILTLNQCAKSCSSNPSCNLINTINSSSMGCNAHALGLNECVEISLRHRRR